MPLHVSSDETASLRPAATELLAVTLALAVASGAAAPVAAGSGVAETDPGLVVSLSASGDADVVLTLTYDLATDEERAAFASLRDDATAREELTVRFRDRLRAVAAAAENRTGRSMAVHHATASVSTTDGGTTGVVTLRVVWEGLAAVDDGRLVVTEPFASGFSTDRRFAVVGPEGYQVGTVAPAPDERSDRRAAWAAGAAFDGFEVTFVDGVTPATPATGGDTGDGGTPTTTRLPDSPPVPGPGPAAAAVAAAVAALLLARQSR